MRTLLLLLLLGCRANDTRALQLVDEELRHAEPQGTRTGMLLERRAAVLEKLGRFAEAAEAYEAAAAAYSQSPEGNRQPVTRAEHARAEAQRLRQLLH